VLFPLEAILEGRGNFRSRGTEFPERRRRGKSLSGCSMPWSAAAGIRGPGCLCAFPGFIPRALPWPRGFTTKAAVHEEMGEPGKAVSSYRETAEVSPELRKARRPVERGLGSLIRKGLSRAVGNGTGCRNQTRLRLVEKALYWKAGPLEKAGQTARENRARLLKFSHSYYSVYHPKGPANFRKGGYPLSRTRPLPPMGRGQDCAARKRQAACPAKSPASHRRNWKAPKRRGERG
jgi:hypothetical protein